MRITYDKKAKAVYIYLTEENLKVAHTAPIEDNIFIDYSHWGTPIGIEILYEETVPVVEEI